MDANENSHPMQGLTSQRAPADSESGRNLTEKNWDDSLNKKTSITSGGGPGGCGWVPAAAGGHI